MKKILFLLSALALLLSLSLPAQAQKVESRSRSLTIFEEPKAPSPHRWVLNLGGGIAAKEKNGESYENYGIFIASVAFEQFFHNSEWYWGVNLGVTNYEDDNGVSGVTPYLGPKFGVTHPIGSNLALEAHLSPNLQVCPSSDESIWRIRANLGVGLWIKRFYAGLEYSYVEGFNYNWFNHNHYSLLLGLKF